VFVPCEAMSLRASQSLLPMPPVIANEVKQSRWRGTPGDCFSPDAPRNDNWNWNHE